MEHTMLKLVYILVLRLIIADGNQDIGWLWHVSDFHYDFSYWSDQLSCREGVESPGIYGDYWCDSPWLLIKDSIESMQRIKPDVDFLLWTGDNIAHIKDEYLTITKNLGTIQNITIELKSKFPGIPVYATLGNHDYLPNNQLPPNTNEIYNQISILWKDWINDTDQVQNFKEGAYYSVKTRHGLRILGLNTNLYYFRNKVTTNMIDPAGQFVWLDQQLTSAKQNNEKVLITAHIPPGFITPSNDMSFTNNFNNKYLEIINKHVDNDVIVGMYYGHEHADGFKVFYKSDGTPAFPVLIAPSVTPWIYDLRHNPGIKLISYDRKTGQSINILMYYINLPDSNSNNKTDWKLEYNFTDVYKVDDVSASSLDKLTKKMAYDKSLVEMYFRFQYVSVDNATSCDDDCRQSILCGIRKHKMDEFLECKQSSSIEQTKPVSSYKPWFMSISVCALTTMFAIINSS